MDRPKFSLILGTLGRTDQLARFLESIRLQKCQSLELIIVDQNADDRVDKLLKDHPGQHTVVHLRSKPGLSRARNLALKVSRGDIIAFPDDDCWYPIDLLDTVAGLLDSDWDGVSGRCLDAEGEDCGLNLDRENGPIDRYNVWRRGTSASMFLKRRVVEAVGEFDETLGLGSGTPYGSAEDIDYLIRAVQQGFSLRYLAEVFVHHPKAETANTKIQLKRTRTYGAGMGRVLTKHRYPLWFKSASLISPLLGAVVALARFDSMQARLRWNRCLGRRFGLMSSSQSTGATPTGTA